jgi:hypothetical protein
VEHPSTATAKRDAIHRTYRCGHPAADHYLGAETYERYCGGLPAMIAWAQAHEYFAEALDRGRATG